MITPVKDVETPLFVRKDDRQIVYFNSQYHLVDYIQGLHDQKGGVLSKKEDSDKQWVFGTEFDSPEKTRAAIEGGMIGDKLKANTEIIMSAVEGLEELQVQNQAAKSMKRHRKYSDDGGELDIDRYLSGMEEHWYSVTKGLQRPVVRLGVNYAMSCGNSEDSWAWMGALVGIAAQMLSRAGLSVEVVGLFSSHNLTDQCKESAVVYTLKEAMESLDIYRIMSPSAVGFFRYYGFGVYRHCFDGYVDDALGYARGTTPEFKKILNLDHVLEISWGREKEKNQKLCVDFLTSLHRQIIEPNYHGT